MLQDLYWLLQKFVLKQDVFLLSAPSPYSRHLVLTLLHLLNLPFESIALTRDTTGESDLKQRRDIDRGSVVWTDGPAVKAAIHGRVLLLEGIEKAERSVVTVLNNLLENREINLEDGRQIIHPDRYDKLLQSHSRQELHSLGLVRASEDFWVVCLGIPVPPYNGNPLDPPFRSRFQVRYIEKPLEYDEEALHVLARDQMKKIKEIVQVVNYAHELGMSHVLPENRTPFAKF